MDDAQDEWLPLPTGQAGAFRSAVQAEFARHGRQVTMEADRAVDEDGTTYGLWNVAAMCRNADVGEWSDIIARHIAVVSATFEDPMETLTEDELRAAVHYRLVEASTVADPSLQPSAPRIGDDLLAVLSVDLPTTIVTPEENAWTERGGLERWRGFGTDNLRALMASGQIEHEHVRMEDGGDFHLAAGDSFYSSSIALVVDEVVRRFEFAGTRTDRGVLVVVPFRHMMAWCVVDGPVSALALNTMFVWAQARFADSPGPLSPHVYWVRDGAWQQVTRIVDGRPEVVVDAALNDALGTPRDG